MDSCFILSIPYSFLLLSTSFSSMIEASVILCLLIVNSGTMSCIGGIFGQAGLA